MAIEKTIRQFRATSHQYWDAGSKSPFLIRSLLLFSVFPLAGEIVVWLSFRGLGLGLAHERVRPGADQYGLLAVILVPLILSYLWVRRLDHPVFGWLWLYVSSRAQLP